MGISIENELRLLTDIVSADGDFFSVGEGMRFFEMLCRLRELYGYEDDSAQRGLQAQRRNESFTQPELRPLP